MNINLIDFWRIKRHKNQNSCIIRPFHTLIADTLTRLTLGILGKQNLMILMPPRMAKTDLGVKAFIPWAMSYFPDSEFIITSASSSLAADNSSDIRRTLSAGWYRDIVDSCWGANITMRGDKAGGLQDYFHTLEGGAVKAVGNGGLITGFGAGKLREDFGGCIIIDDPLKAQDARSPAMRLSAISYIQHTLRSRRNNDITPIILIMQRLHPNDPAGMLLKEERDKWHVLQIPALDNDDKSIWEERLSTQSLIEMREGKPDLFWSQYQQSPTESANTIFKEYWWKFWADIKEVEARINMKIITADTAFKAKDSSDFSVFQCWGIEGTSGLYLIDQLRGRWEFPELIKNAQQFWSKHSKRETGLTPATEFWIEDKASGTSLVQVFRRDGLIPARAWEPSDKTSPDKVGRAKSCTMPISAGRVFLPSPKLPGFQWVNDFINEHEGFTEDDSHSYDDQVDTHTMANLIWQQRGGSRGVIPAPFM